MITIDGVVKILDFGLAKLAGKTLHTKTGSTIGTVDYVSPEQVQSLSIDFRSDIWSLGVIFYEMLSGEKPFKGEFDQAVMYSIVNNEPDPVNKYNLDIPTEFVRIIKQALKKDPDDR
jgi:serine/threonine-protein kinase